MRKRSGEAPPVRKEGPLRDIHALPLICREGIWKGGILVKDVEEKEISTRQNAHVKGLIAQEVLMRIR